MSLLQIILLSISGVCVLSSIVFMIMFVVEITVENCDESNSETQSVFINNEINIVEEEKESASVSDMLANLDKQAEEEVVEEVEANSDLTEVIVEDEAPSFKIEEVEEESTEEVAEEPTEEIVEEPTEEVVEETAEEVVEEPTTEETSIEEVSETLDGGVEEESSEDENIDEILEFKSEPHEEITAGSVIDYNARLEKIIANRDKIDRDLGKIQKSILKYERTKRRMARNQKMLDRRAGELTNLNLVMYSVTDIKNVDEEKKAKQEELTAHIAELKASIQDADEFIESNKEKNDHNVKMAKFLLQEKSRYNEEIAELQELIRRNDDSTENQ